MHFPLNCPGYLMTCKRETRRFGLHLGDSRIIQESWHRCIQSSKKVTGKYKRENHWWHQHVGMQSVGMHNKEFQNQAYRKCMEISVMWNCIVLGQKKKKYKLHTASLLYNGHMSLHPVPLISHLITNMSNSTLICKIFFNVHVFKSPSTGCSLFRNNSGKRLPSLGENNGYPIMQIRCVFQWLHVCLVMSGETPLVSRAVLCKALVNHNSRRRSERKVFHKNSRYNIFFRRHAANLKPSKTYRCLRSIKLERNRSLENRIYNAYTNTKMVSKQHTV